MSKSYATLVYEDQGNKKYGFPGRDSVQEGKFVHGKPTTLYQGSWFENPTGNKLSGYFTDQSTIESAIDSDTGKLNSNILANKIQTAPASEEYANEDGTRNHKPFCNAYEINWDNLDKLKESNFLKNTNIQ